jgi:hypothetical protein
VVLLQFGSRFACLETAEEETRSSPHGLGRMPSLLHRVAVKVAIGRTSAWTNVLDRLSYPP